MRIVSCSFHMLCDIFIVLSIPCLEFKFVIKPNNRILCFIFNLFVGGINITPEVFAEYLLIVECVRNESFHLFFDGSIKIL